MALTDLALRKARPGPKPYKITDSHGLFLLVQPAGGKLWRFKFRFDGREKKLAIGTYPEIVLGEARRRRDEAREAMAVRRQNIWHNSRRKLAECGPRLGVDVMRRACGVASVDIRWSVV